MLFIEKLDYLLNRNRMSGHKLSTDLNLGKNAYNNWKIRKNIPSGDILIKIADYFGVSVDYLLDREKPFFPAITEEEILIETFRGCDEERQAAILRYAIDQRQLCELHSQTADKGGD